MEIAASKMPNRIQSLDGLRAFSIALVLLLHMSGSKNFISYQAIEPFGPGALGVKIFFVISAFLITSLLLKELGNTGTISLRGFYIRRALRILPAFGSFVIVAAILTFTGVIFLRKVDFLHAATFTMNYANHTWWLGHLWSLSVEEQFYFVWPVALCFMGRINGMKLAAVVVIVVPLIRLAIWVLLPSYRGSLGFGFESCADSFAIGCLLAGFRDWLGRQQSYLKFLESWLFVLVPVGILLGSMSFVRPRIQAIVGVTLENVCIAILIDYAIRFPAGRLGKVLNFRPIMYVGTLSYSIYLWQQLFCRRVEFQNWTTAFPANLILLSACALVSFYFVEQPALRLKDRLFGKNTRKDDPASQSPTRPPIVIRNL